VSLQSEMEKMVKIVRENVKMASLQKKRAGLPEYMMLREDRSGRKAAPIEA
jgi:hypothetical protein